MTESTRQIHARLFCSSQAMHREIDRMDSALCRAVAERWRAAAEICRRREEGWAGVYGTACAFALLIRDTPRRKRVVDTGERVFKALVRLECRRKL